MDIRIIVKDVFVKSTDSGLGFYKNENDIYPAKIQHLSTRYRDGRWESYWKDAEIEFESEIVKLTE